MAISKRHSILRCLWALFALASSYPVLAAVFGVAVWGGVNFFVGLYLFISIAGVIGLLAGLYAAFSPRSFFAWAACAGALSFVVLSAILAAGFIFGRDPSLPLDSGATYFGRFHAPDLVLYAIAIVFCGVEFLLYFPTAIKREAT
jgi:hypothetical protein